MGLDRYTSRKALLLGAATLLCSTSALAQTAGTAPAQTAPAAAAADQAQSPGAPAPADSASPANAAAPEIVVTGIRATQRSSIQVKRDATTIVDAISANEIGVLPDNSIAETLERVVGVSGDRFKGSASELSIRGLGPFLGFATINGRDISSGGGNRSVSFQQFPSELTRGVVVYKAQEADLVEGGVAGVVNVLTGKPLDFHGRHIDLNVKGQYDPYAARFNDESGFGYRASASYTDRFQTGIGEFGIILGYFRAHDRVPEDFYTTSSSWRPCNTLATKPATSTTNCSVATKASSTTTLSDTPYFISNSYNYRELATSENRESFLGSVQWRPARDLNIIADFESSTRDDIEGWHDLVLLDGRRGIGAATIDPNGVLASYSGNSRIGAQTRYRDRFERYTGGGLAADWTPGQWTVHADLDESRSHRVQTDRSAALGTTAFIPYTVTADGHDIPALTFTNFDPTNAAVYNSTTAANWSSNTTDFVDDIKAGTFDVTRHFESSFLSSIKAGFRYSDRHHQSLSATGASHPVTSLATINAAIGTCQAGFQETNWGSDAKGGPAQPSSWATFDPLCLYRAMSGGDAATPVIARDPGNVDVDERTLAGYVMASFGSHLGTLPFNGNVGVRVIRTNEKVNGFSSALHATQLPDGFITLTADAVNLQPVSARNSFTDVLPSLNLSFDVSRDFKVRAAVYKALARPNMEEMSAGRTFTTLSGEATTVQAALASASGGNPRLEPLTAWNYDLSFEYYPDPLTILSFAPYYKVLQAAFTTVSTPETVLVDGTPFAVNIAQLANSNQKSWLRGFEVTAQHAFRNLPTPLNGLGAQLNYSFAQTNYKFADPSAVDPAHPLADFTDPAGIIGLSKHVASATVYWSNDRFELRATYRYRSGYFKPLEPTGAAANRYVDSGSFVDASLRYTFAPHAELQLQVANITNTPQIFYRPVVGEIAQTEYSGRTIFAGIRIRY
ncbi:MAG TPA: TonB-dependent receptor [Allosphingosinicella sp.]|jgi:TonB-dependent receptor|nr:TonB-dependent receptor [Allosphingosinicella sp.]